MVCMWAFSEGEWHIELISNHGGIVSAAFVLECSPFSFFYVSFFTYDVMVHDVFGCPPGNVLCVGEVCASQNITWCDRGIAHSLQV